jgi:hypothetical protein
MIATRDVGRVISGRLQTPTQTAGNLLRHARYPKIGSGTAYRILYEDLN